MKVIDKRRQKLLVTKPQVMNRFGNAKSLFETLRLEDEIYSSTSEILDKNKLKQCSMVKLNDYVDPILTDMDPEQDVEEEYKRKHD